MVLDAMRRWWNLDRPRILPMEDWEQWHQDARRRQPLPYWCQITVPRWLRRIWYTVCRPIHQTRDWVQCRTTRRYHWVRTGLAPGYTDIPEKMLWTNFTMLVDLVEVERADNLIWADDRYRSLRGPWWRRWLGMEPRRPELGRESLRQTIVMLDDEPEVYTSLEMLYLYDWWTRRPNRPDPDDASGWNQLRNTLKDTAPSVRLKDPSYLAAMDLSDDIDDEYQLEDQTHLKRLIEIRNHLWT